MDFYVGRPCENFRRIQSYTILECKKRGHWRPFEIQLCAADPTSSLLSSSAAAADDSTSFLSVLGNMVGAIQIMMGDVCGMMMHGIRVMVVGSAQCVWSGCS